MHTYQSKTAGIMHRQGEENVAPSKGCKAVELEGSQGPNGERHLAGLVKILPSR